MDNYYCINPLSIQSPLLGHDVHFRMKRDDAYSSFKGLSGLGEVDPGFVKVKPNKVLVENPANEAGNKI